MLATALTILLAWHPAQASHGQGAPPDAVAQSRAALAAAAAGEFDAIEAQFTPEMKAALPPGRLAAMWAGVQLRAGAFRSCDTSPKVVDIGDKRMVITRCEFEHGAFDVQFAFDTTKRMSGLVFRPRPATGTSTSWPPYARPADFAESPIAIGTGQSALPGTLAVPAGNERVPAVVLVHGSGPQDRDESIGPNKPFRDLAAGLASRGIAVLRYDKRTYVQRSNGAPLSNYTVREEVIDDALAAVSALRAQPRIDASRIFVLGHSLGGMLVPRIAAADASIAGFVVAAGPAATIEDAIVAQAHYLASVDGSISAGDQKRIDEAKALHDRVRAITPAGATSGRLISGAPESYWLDLRGYEAPVAARAVKAPLLILQGERDFQVTMADLSRWKSVLSSRRDVAFRSYPSLNHLFIAGSGPSLPAEYQKPGHVAEQVIHDIADWVLTAR